ncbi:MAG: carboxypeptidase regulatory-like domain-containing protein [bacterium]|nr:carboxypeptidase regulatory-like domain-containing protein [bacterium]
MIFFFQYAISILGGNMKIRFLILSITLLILFTFGQLYLFPDISCRVEGEILDKDTGLPIEGAKVKLYEVDKNNIFRIYLEWQTATDNKGRFRFQLGSFFARDSRMFRIQCHKDGYVRFLPEIYRSIVKKEYRETLYRAFSLKEGEIKHLKIKMEKGGALKGTLHVKDVDGLKPYKGNGYLLLKHTTHQFILDKEKLSLPTRDTLWVSRIVTDENGNFALDGLIPSTSYMIRFTHNSYKRMPLEMIQIKKNETNNYSYTLDITDKSGIKGVASIDNHTLHAGTVRAKKKVESGSPGDYCICAVGEDGNYSCLGLSPGEYQITVSATSKDLKMFRKTLDVVVESGKTKELDIELKDEVKLKD